MKALRIVDWKEHYETVESKRTKTLSWVATPNGHGSKAFRKMAKRPDFLVVFGAWNILLQQASKCAERGLLVNGKGEPYLAVDFADLTGGTVVDWEKSIVALISIKWIEEIELSGNMPEPPVEMQGAPAHPRALQGTPALQDSTGQYRTVQYTATTSPTREPPTPEGNGELFTLTRIPRTALGGPKNFADWRIQVGKRIFFDREESGEWRALFEAEGWDEMTRGYEHLAKKKPEPGKIFLSDFQGIR